MRTILLRRPWAIKLIFSSSSHRSVHSFCFYFFFVNHYRIIHQCYSTSLSIGERALNHCLFLFYWFALVCIDNVSNSCFHFYLACACFCHPDRCRNCDVSVCLNYFNIIVCACVIQSNGKICSIAANFFWICLIQNLSAFTNYIHFAQSFLIFIAETHI